MSETLTLVAVAVAFAGFLWLIYNALRSAWDREQAYKAQEVTWEAAHPVPPATARRLQLGNLLAIPIGLAAVVWLTTVAGLNVGPACLIVAIPVLIARRVKRYRRERDAENANRFGDYTPSFRE